MGSADCGQRGLIRPEPDQDSAGWWAAIQSGRFVLPRCGSCARYSFPPQSTCPHCGAGPMGLVDASGAGTVYSWVVVHRALDATFADDVPYTIVSVDLGEGPRMFGRLCAEGRAVRAGEHVQARIYEVQGQRLVGFEPSGPERVEGH